MKNNKNAEFKVAKTEDDWKKVLSKEEYHVLREKGTEPPFYYEDNFKIIDGSKYCCKACDSPIFNGDSAFDSNSGWPSFDKAIPGSVKEVMDDSLGMNRIEIVCAKCGSHLGHLFNDGLTQTGKRYCINSISLKPEEDKKS